jgi:hypothetical protein
MPLYRAYGLTIDSELELPELEPVGGDGRSADLSIRIGPVPPQGLVGGQQLGPFMWADPANIWLHVPGVARFLATGGHTITVDPDPAPAVGVAGGAGVGTAAGAGAAGSATPAPDPDSIRVFLLGSGLGAALCQRGLLVLHGNAVQVGEACMCAVGHSGTGKSTLAAGFWRRGHAILADDVVAVDSNCCALPGFPRIKLWQDSADKLSVDTSALRRVRPSTNKFNLPVAPARTGALPLRWVYILDVHNGPDLRLEPITGLARFTPLHNNTYRVRFLDGMAMKGEHLKLCGQLAGRIRLVKVSRPREGFTLDALIDALMADMAEHP